MTIGLAQHITVEESTSIQWVNGTVLQLQACSFTGFAVLAEST